MRAVINIFFYIIFLDMFEIHAEIKTTWLKSFRMNEHLFSLRMDLCT